jgi:hypothetical protein
MMSSEAHRFRNIRYGVLDLKQYLLSDPALLMLWLRDAMAANKELSFPAFDLGFAMYWNSAYPGQSMPAFRGGWLNEEKHEVGADALQVGAEMLLQHALPFVGNALRRLAVAGIKAGRRHYTIETNECIRRLFKDGDPHGDPLPPYEIREELPALLASCLGECRERSPDIRFVLLIDEYEKLFEYGALAAAARDNAFDKMMRDFVSAVQGTLVTIFGRERLAWPAFVPDWKAWVEGAHHLLGGLAWKDADAFLQAVPVDDPKLREAMVEGASSLDQATGEKYAFPFMLDLQIDHFLAFKSSGAGFSPASLSIGDVSFEERRATLLRRVLRQYDLSLESALKRLAVARRFDRSLARYLVTRFATGFPTDRLQDLLRLSFVEELIGGGTYVMHQVIRDGLALLLGSDEVRATQQALLEYFEEKAQSTDRQMCLGSAMGTARLACRIARSAPTALSMLVMALNDFSASKPPS